VVDYFGVEVVAGGVNGTGGATDLSEWHANMDVDPE
jgi:hypothetical protein